MDDFTNEEVATVVSYAIAFDNCEEALRRFKSKFGKEGPQVRTLRKWRQRFLETLSVQPRKSGADQSHRRVSDELRQSVVDSFHDEPRSSQRQVSREVGVSLSSVNRIVKTEGLHPWKFTPVQELKDVDYPKRLLFCSQILQREEERPNWSNNIVFSDEASFHVNGQVNLHNSFYYAADNPHLTTEKPMKSPAVTFWVMISYQHGLTHRVIYDTVNSENYASILEETVVPFIRPRRSLVFQQDGAPAHFSLRARAILDAKLHNRWIGRGSTFLEWPPRSPDLTINDFWLWGCVRNNVYKAPRPRTLDELEMRISDFLNSIDIREVRRCYDSFRKRCRLCFSNNGRHIENLL